MEATVARPQVECDLHDRNGFVFDVIVRKGGHYVPQAYSA